MTRGRYSQESDMKRRRWPGGSRVAIATLPVVAASILGQLATYPNLASWYAGLAKPWFNPPNWVFAPVWTILYVLMACSVWRILKLGRRHGERRTGLLLFFTQLALNALWSWLFFGFHSPFAGLLNILPQWLLIMGTTICFRKIDLVAAICLVPLAVWVAFASVLNFEIWRLNL